jgi:membrane-associated phospholipid phosphatase
MWTRRIDLEARPLVAGVYLALGLSSISAMLLVRLFLLVLISTSVSSAYSVLTHEAIVDALWDTSLKTMFLERFPAATLEELEQAHAYAYGGCIIQDLGYYPFSSRLFSDLTHYVRSGDFIITPYFERASFQETPAVREFNRMVSGRNAALAIAAVPVSFYLAGFVRKDSYARQTALLAGEAIANAEIVAAAIKNAGRRVRPSAVPRGGNFSDTWFRARSASAGGSGSFPSAHTAAAFSVATVFAGRYRRHRWAPLAAYGLAGLIGFSRVSARAHFPSDVFLGAALGYSIGHFVVLKGGFSLSGRPLPPS